MKRPRLNRSGFTLLEATVAMIVLAAAIGTVMQLGTQAVRLRAESHRRLLADVELSNALDRLLAQPFDQLEQLETAVVSLSALATQRLPQARLEVTISSDESATEEPTRDGPTETAGDDGASLDALRVQVTMVWNDTAGTPVEPLRLTGWKYRWQDRSTPGSPQEESP